MKNQKSFIQVVVCCVWLLVIVIGCSSSNDISTPSLTTTGFHTPMVTPNSALTASVRIYPTVTSNLPSTKIVTPTKTPQPTLLPDEAKQMTLDLLQNNANCELPCWWGIIPGQTTWEDAQKLLLQFYPKPYIRELGEESFIASFLIPVYEKILSSYPEYFFTFRNGIAEEMLITPGNITRYYFSNLVGTLGQPDEVWIRTYANAHSNSSGDTVPFGIALFYVKKGIVASYNPDAIKREGQIHACLGETEITELGLWNPAENMNSDEASDVFKVDSEAWPYKTLREATGLDEASFYKKYLDGKGIFCLDTTAELWWPLP